MSLKILLALSCFEKSIKKAVARLRNKSLQRRSRAITLYTGHVLRHDAMEPFNMSASIL